MVGVWDIGCGVVRGDGEGCGDGMARFFEGVQFGGGEVEGGVGEKVGGGGGDEAGGRTGEGGGEDGGVFEGSVEAGVGEGASEGGAKAGEDVGGEGLGTAAAAFVAGGGAGEREGASALPEGYAEGEGHVEGVEEEGGTDLHEGEVQVLFEEGDEVGLGDTEGLEGFDEEVDGVEGEIGGNGNFGTAEAGVGGIGVRHTLV